MARRVGIPGAAGVPTGAPTQMGAGITPGTGNIVPSASRVAPNAGITGRVTPGSSNPQAISFKQGYDTGLAKAATKKVKGQAGTSTPAPKKMKTSASPTKSSFKPEPSTKPKKGLAGVLARNKPNIQAKALERMKASGRKG